MKNRRGLFLVELLVVMSATTIILTMSAVLIARMMRTHSAASDFFDAQRGAVRLSVQFRQDVHQTTRFILGDVTSREAAILQLDLTDGRHVDYWRQNTAILRILSKDSKTESREEFPFPWELVVAVREEVLPRRLVLEVAGEPRGTLTEKERRSAYSQGMNAGVQVEAVIGRDLHSGRALIGSETRK